MRRNLRSRVLIFALLLAVSAGSVLSVVQAGQMRIDMAMAGDAQDQGDNGCRACGSEGGGATAPVNCASACYLAAVDTVDEASVADAFDTQEFHAGRPPALLSAVPKIGPSPAKLLLG